MAGNALAAAGRVAAAVATGNAVLVDAMTFAVRRAICIHCPHCLALPRTPEVHRCTKCGCWIDGEKVGKAKLATERCPEGRWEAEP